MNIYTKIKNKSLYLVIETRDYFNPVLLKSYFKVVNRKADIMYISNKIIKAKEPNLFFIDFHGQYLRLCIEPKPEFIKQTEIKKPHKKAIYKNGFWI